MVFPSSWHNSFADLQTFISEKSGVELSESLISIPDAYKTRFFRLFDSVRELFLEERLPIMLNDLQRLGGRFKKAEQVAMASLDLDAVRLPVRTERVLRDPRRGLAAEMFNPLMDLLVGRLLEGEFGVLCEEKARRSATDSYTEGYQKCLELETLALIQPDSAYWVPLYEPTSKEIIKRSDVPVALPKPHLAIQQLKLGSSGHPILIVPEVIVHSLRGDFCVGIAANPTGAIWIAEEYPRIHEWLDSYLQVDLSDCLLVYLGASPEELAFIGDRQSLRRPHLAIECCEGYKAYDDEAFQRTKTRHAFLQPFLGSIVVREESFSEVSVADGITFISDNELGVIAEKLMNLTPM